MLFNSLSSRLFADSSAHIAGAGVRCLAARGEPRFHTLWTAYVVLLLFAVGVNAPAACDHPGPRRPALAA
jgi:hypothetical protein